MDRNDFIGSSDIASIMGMSRWKTALQLWAEKTGKVEAPDLSENEAVQLGTELEDFVAKKFEKQTGKKVRRSPKLYIHARYSHFRCQVDRLIEGTDELLECKTCSAWKKEEWEGEEIPNEYILQVMWQLGITGRSKGYIAVLIGGQSFKYKEIIFDKELFDKMLLEALKFWDCVKNDLEPLAVGDDVSFIQDLHPKSSDKILETEDLNHKIDCLVLIKNQIKDLTDDKNTIEANIKQYIGDNLGITSNKYKITWATQSRRYVDTELLKKAGLYEQYSQEKETRVLRIKEQKGE